MKVKLNSRFSQNHTPCKILYWVQSICLIKIYRSRIWGSLRGKNINADLDCKAVWTCKYLPVFRRSILHPLLVMFFQNIGIYLKIYAALQPRSTTISKNLFKIVFDILNRPISIHYASPLLPRYATFTSCGWRKRPPGVEGTCE